MNKAIQKELLNIVKRNYEEIAEDFFHSRQKKLWPALKKLTSKIGDGTKILDVGCGNGRLLKNLLNKKIKYLGIDQNEKLTKLAKKYYQTIKPTPRAKFEFRLGNVLELNKITEINFDYIFFVAVLHHLPGVNLRQQALRQLKNKINNQGKIIITVWNLWRHRKGRRLLARYTLLKLIGKNKMDWGDVLFYWRDKTGRPVSQRYYHAFRRRELKRLIKKTGLKIDKFLNDGYNYYIVVKKKD
jgi:2-polyprenyl-3-methyl-5-hydroxy-6-metoxy-1,4-benzoquinol methylase